MAEPASAPRNHERSLAPFLLHATPPPSVLTATFARSAARTSGLRISLLLFGAGIVGACDIPSAAPRWETHWLVRTETATIPVTAFFSSQVSLVENAFLLSVTGGAVSQTLADLCPACVPFNGLVVPKPAFTATLRSDVPFPVDLDSIALTRGSIQVRVTNRLGFDPLRPGAGSGAARGQIRIVISNGSTVLGTHTIDGAVTSFAPGSTLDETITMSPVGLPRTIGGSVNFDVTLQSPAGDPVTINTAEFVLIEAAEASVGASAAKVRVQDRMVATAPLAIDLSGIDAELTRRIVRGALLLDIANPFAVSGVLTATLSAGGTTLVRPVAVAPGDSRVSLEFSGAELRSLLGPAPVTLSVAGRVSASPAGLVTLLPGHSLTAAGRLELYLSTNMPEEGR